MAAFYDALIRDYQLLSSIVSSMCAVVDTVCAVADTPIRSQRTDWDMSSLGRGTLTLSILGTWRVSKLTVHYWDICVLILINWVHWYILFSFSLICRIWQLKMGGVMKNESLGAIM